MFLSSFLGILANMDNNSRFLLSMIILIIILLIIVIIVSAISAKKEEERIKKAKKPTDRSQIEDKLKKLDFQFQEAKKEEKIEKAKEVFSEELEKKIDEEIEMIEIEEENEIEAIAKQIENSVPKQFNLNEFEREQEESAIISYDELVKKAGAKKIVYKKEEVLPEKPIQHQVKTGFTPSQVVSPIYGIQNKELPKRGTLTREERNQTLNSTDNEIIDDIDFLNNLKQFRRELQ